MKSAIKLVLPFWATMVLAHSALAGSIAQAALQFQNAVQSVFNGEDIEKIQNFELRGQPKEADQIIQDRLKEWFPALFQKGLAEKCAVFRFAGLCEVTIIQRIHDEDYRRKMDEIYEAVR